MVERKKILLGGASGLVGRALRAFLEKQGHTVIPLVRIHDFPEPSVYWDPASKTADFNAFENFDAFIYLGGESLVDGWWTEAKKQRLYASRVLASRFLAQIITSLKNPPSVVLTASAIGFYGDRGEAILDESSPRGEGFLAKLCEDWENALQGVPLSVRTVQMRFGIILSPEGGFLKTLKIPIQLGLGAYIGDGNQYISWITLEDAVRAIHYLLSNPAASGIFNLTTKEPLPQRVFLEKLASQQHRPFFLRIPKWLISFFLREKSSLLLFSQRVFPKRLEEIGFAFANPFFDAALERLFSDFS